MKKYNIPVEGMTCASCVARVEKVAKKFENVTNVSVNLATEKISFDSVSDDFDMESLAKEIEEYGYKLNYQSEEKKPKSSNKDDNTLDQHNEEDSHYKKLKIDFFTAFIFTLPVFAISMLMDFEFFQSIWKINQDYTNKILFLLTTPVIFISGKRFYIIFWNNLKHFTAEMNSLVAIGTAAAFGYSVVTTLFPTLVISAGQTPHVYFETAGVIITLILLGRLLEHRAKRKTKGAIKALLELKPKHATIIIDGSEETIDISDLQIGHEVVVKPGEKIPADGIILTGYSTIDESMLTGESIPVEKGKNSKVIGGTINKNGSFNYEITAIGDNSVLGQIIRLVEEAQGSKAPIQKLADKIASIFTPSVVLISIITFTGWMIFATENNFNVALINFVAVLIIACPCALGLATPTAIMVGTGLGAKHGILIKNGESLQEAKKISTIILDKTGTITEGKPTVTDIIPIDIEDNNLLQIVGSVENKSEHPIAEAVVSFAKNKNIQFDKLESFQSMSGFGITGILNGDAVAVGNQKLMSEYSINLDAYNETLKELSSLGKTVIYAARNGKLIGIIAVEDPIKKTSEAAISILKQMKLRVVIITGDNSHTAQAIAERVGVDEYLAEVLPEDKVNKVKEFQKDGKTVAMVGDGINDAPALAQADVGIAIGTGTDVAIETAQITLVKGDLMDVVSAIHLSRRTIRTIKQNLFWAFIYNIIGIPLAALGLLNPMFAALAMSLSSVSVVTNSLRLRSTKL
ncbi:MAG: heavy metal translocating P-type ATPase [Melioribacteraceae bacterium]|nr:heavy metal translocating P-type ATPase [Melioribacteraceae bacterium]MCF8356815.1 heavy metal translocating P-type ATPase [Melioribacteraceae bacterium]MCF8394260.1 heavy metal translocating P-type ATPase [Melioribacteraceae bacterium]MCF8418160.1 heavy metal translocating P-type ATPase [Melioribacteraceae bacterium]